ncbi:MAG: ATP-dependent DNA helicase [ANME-2 cluster archaeon]|nr:ATP-dependent DNA helicase [ANME-2 cluster archaeon]
MDDDIDRWFPYPEYRPNQREMLDKAAEIARTGGHGVLMVDAPTGSGKTSILSALLASRGDNRIVVAVRTISQVSIYLDEIQKIRKHTNKRPKVAYLVGKDKTCLLRDELDSVYRGCDILKIMTRQLLESRMREYMQATGKGNDAVYDPSKDDALLDSIMDERGGERSCCPHYLQAKEAYFFDGEIKFRSSKKALQTVRDIKDTIIYPEELAEHCGNLCPYEVMGVSAEDADVVTLNYNHVFDDEYRDAMYSWLGLEPEKTILLIDEAHNLGDAVRAMISDKLTEFSIKKAIKEVETSRRLAKISGLNQSLAVADQILPRILTFMEKMAQKGQSSEEWFDPHMFADFVFGESLVREDDRMAGELMNLADVIERQKAKESESPEIHLQKVGEFLFMLNFAKNDEAYIPLKYTDERTVGENTYHSTTLEIRNIDPSMHISSVMDNHHASIMISGTLSPPEAYELYYFGKNGRATILTLPNQFPPENRLILVASKATTQSSQRTDVDNVAEIQQHLDSFIRGVPGNVVVYFTSYGMLDNYLDFCTGSATSAGKRIYQEPRESRDVPAILSQFFQAGLKKATKPGVLLAVAGGKMSEGIDYRGESLKGSTVVGLPLTAYTEVQKSVNDYYKNKYGTRNGLFIAYTLPAMNKALQALGRVHRAAEEEGVLVLCDSRFANRGGIGVREYLPEWMDKEMKVCNGGETGQLIADWMKKHKPALAPATISAHTPTPVSTQSRTESGMTIKKARHVQQLEQLSQKRPASGAAQKHGFQTGAQVAGKSKVLSILNKMARSHDTFYLGAVNNHLKKGERVDTGDLKEMFTPEDFAALGLEARFIASVGDVELRRTNSR